MLADGSDVAVLAATNCDNPPAARLVNPDAIANKAKAIVTNIAVYKTALHAEGRPRAITQALVSEVVARRRCKSLDVPHLSFHYSAGPLHEFVQERCGIAVIVSI